ncbi:GGDEF domain-containing protein [Cognatilysobacter lacus]|uniref:diguanylate cyclase n=1 Tax=Cognatilysobacter lacus TaxID=1643323 RepID=A0A5D8Z7G8_9GAMM|nr:diguanylate cyclase [Lysobacter lacus]TZF90486.1 diguanylate cyclase [Lysobacter lacus]
MSASSAGDSTMGRLARATRVRALISTLADSTRVPVACASERDRIVRMRVRTLAPVLAVLTIAWIALDAAVLQPVDAVRIGLLRILMAAALVLLSRATWRLSATGTLRAFVWTQALGFGAMEWLLQPAHVAGQVGYGLFPFVIVTQLALFPAPWLQTLRTAVAPAASLLFALHRDGRALSIDDWRDAWLLVLLTGVAAWTGHAQLRLLVELLGARREASEDALTGLANRRTLDARLAAEAARARRHGQPLSLLMLDLDRFKVVNDEYGHAAGDRVLAAAANALADELRSIDLGARFGGEEFVAVLPDTPLGDAMRVAERIRRRIAAMPATVQGRTIPVTVSIGAAELADSEGIAGVLARTDAALYRAKRGGRDRCVAAPPSVRAPADSTP